eukprot:scaffold62263_cov79-Cyclotella_meneghiniana.AAC.1
MQPTTTTATNLELMDIKTIHSSCTSSTSGSTSPEHEVFDEEDYITLLRYRDAYHILGLIDDTNAEDGEFLSDEEIERAYEDARYETLSAFEKARRGKKNAFTMGQLNYLELKLHALEQAKLELLGDEFSAVSETRQNGEKERSANVPELPNINSIESLPETTPEPTNTSKLQTIDAFFSSSSTSTKPPMTPRHTRKSSKESIAMSSISWLSKDSELSSILGKMEPSSVSPRGVDDFVDEENKMVYNENASETKCLKLQEVDTVPPNETSPMNHVNESVANRSCRKANKELDEVPLDESPPRNHVHHTLVDKDEFIGCVQDYQPAKGKEEPDTIPKSTADAETIKAARAGVLRALSEDDSDCLNIEDYDDKIAMQALEKILKDTADVTDEQRLHIDAVEVLQKYQAMKKLRDMEMEVQGGTEQQPHEDHIMNKNVLDEREEDDDDDWESVDSDENCTPVKPHGSPKKLLKRNHTSKQSPKRSLNLKPMYSRSKSCPNPTLEHDLEEEYDRAQEGYPSSARPASHCDLGTFGSTLQSCLDLAQSGVELAEDICGVIADTCCWNVNDSVIMCADDEDDDDHGGDLINDKSNCETRQDLYTSFSVGGYSTETNGESTTFNTVSSFGMGNSEALYGASEVGSMAVYGASEIGYGSEVGYGASEAASMAVYSASEACYGTEVAYGASEIGSSVMYSASEAGNGTEVEYCAS